MNHLGNEGQSKGTPWWPLALAIFAVFLVWVSSWGLIQWWYQSDTSRGTFGDMFGAVNALFSGMAFAGLAYAIILQRKELAETQQILKSQKQEAEIQNATLAQQRFDNTFFELLRLHNEIVNAIELRKSADSTQIVATGRKCFKIFYDYLENAYRNKAVGLPANTSQDLLKRIETAYSVFFLEHEKDVGHYFRSLYNIVKFVDKSDIKDKKIYTNLLRAQLSSNELKLLLYNCLSSLGNEKFKPLVEKYSLLKSINVSDLLHGEEDAKIYDASAFGKSHN